VFHAGTAIKDGKLVTAGGRVLCVTGLAPTREEARRKVYAQIDKIRFRDCFHRDDIAATET
ncbi:phosphoribosylglycinamide synthetase C domain-containing protein, partial [Pseudoramibacter alactolyticus]